MSRPSAQPSSRRAPRRTQRHAWHTTSSMLEQLHVGALEVTLPDGRRRVFGDRRSELRSDIEVADWRFFTRLLHGASVGVGESYMLGELTGSTGSTGIVTRPLRLFADRPDGLSARAALNRWRVFTIACEELFAYRGGDEWHVSHVRFVRRS